MKTKLLFIFLSGLLLGSCTREADDLPGGDAVPAVFTSRLADNPEAVSRAANATWTLGDAVGIYMLPSGDYALSSALKSNKQYRASNASSSSALVPDDPTPIYYPIDGSAVRFVAYSPYQSGATANNQVTYTFTDQSTKAKKEAVDFMFYRGTTDRSSTDPAETMRFYHQFCKIGFTVRKATVDGLSCAGMTVALNGMPSTATVDLAARAGDAAQNSATGMSVGTAATISSWTIESSEDFASAEAIVAPHTGTGNFADRTFTFTLDGTTLTYNLPNNVTFQAGMQYFFIFTVSQTAAAFNEVNASSDWNISEVQWDNSSMLATNNTHNLTYGETTSTLMVYVKSIDFSLTRSISATNSKAGAPAWFTNATKTSWNYVGNCYHTLVTLTTTKNTTTSPRTGYLWLTLGGLTTVVTVNQDAPFTTSALPASVDGMSNCYVLKNNSSSVTFPVTRAYTAGYVDLSRPQNFSVKVVWKDADCINTPTISGTGTSAQITVSSKNVTGNAVIALVQDGNVVWSYHIWVAQKLPSEMGTWNPRSFGGTTANPHTVFMGCNLGAATEGAHSGNTGLYYQHSRKDPFALSNVVSDIKVSNAAMTLEETVRYPHVYSRTVPNSSINNYMWWLTGSSSLAQTLWNTLDNKKTIYDPCPQGWRMPYLQTRNDLNTHPFVGVSTYGTATSGSNKFIWFGNSSASSHFPDMNYSSINGTSVVAVTNPSVIFSYLHVAAIYPNNSDYGEYRLPGVRFINANPPIGTAQLGAETAFFGYHVRCVKDS